MKNKKTCCFTGHRNISAEHIVKIPEALDNLLETLISEGFEHFKAGGALGFDTICALKVLEKKKKYPNVTLELCLPCKDQAEAWAEHDRYVYYYVLKLADKVVYSKEFYSKGCMHARNRMLVEGSEVCVAFCTMKSGGTAYTVSYAKNNGLRVINLYDRIK